MTNFTMDGCVCEILLKQIYSFDTVLRAGYGKLKVYHKNGQFETTEHGEKLDKMIFTSMQLPMDIFTSMQDTYADNLSIVDHHEDTEDILTMSDMAKITWNTSKSSARMIYDAIDGIGKVDVRKFKPLVDFSEVYELWQPHRKEWGVGYALNALFWETNYYNFLARYENGITNENKLITDEERAVINGIMKNKRDMIGQAVKEEFDDGKSVMFINVDASIVSDFTIQKEFAHYETYFMVYNNFSGKQTIAVRVNGNFTPKMKVVDACKKACAGRKGLYGGGFGSVGAITINKEKDLDAIIDIVEDIHNHLVKGIDVPDANNDVPY